MFFDPGETCRDCQVDTVLSSLHHLKTELRNLTFNRLGHARALWKGLREFHDPGHGNTRYLGGDLARIFESLHEVAESVQNKMSGLMLREDTRHVTRSDAFIRR